MQSQTVMEQKRKLEEMRKEAEKRVDERRSLLESNVLLKSEDQKIKTKMGCYEAAVSQREQINEKIRNHLQNNLQLKTWQQRQTNDTMSYLKEEQAKQSARRLVEAQNKQFNLMQVPI